MATNRFTIHNYYPELPLGWGCYSEYEFEEKHFYARFLEASKHYKEKFESGDEKAIFTFVKDYPECFREVWPFPDNTTLPCYSKNNLLVRKNGRSWLIEQIEKWKKEDNPESKKKLKKLFAAYIDSRGNKRKSPDEDREIYKQIKKYIAEYKEERGKVSKAIWQVVDNTIETNIPDKLQDILNKYIRKNQNHGNSINRIIDKVAKDAGIRKQIVNAHIKNEKAMFNTYREIYYGMKKMVERYEKEDKPITEKNLRFAYCHPRENIKIPKAYVELFNKEISLYSSIELLRIGHVDFPPYRSGIPAYTGTRDGENLTLKKAIQKVSEERNTPIDELKEVYRKYRKIVCFNNGDKDCLEVLEEL